MDIISQISKLPRGLRNRVEHAILTVSRAIDIYGQEKLAFSFNGGKDSTVVLHIIRAAIIQQQENADSYLKGIGNIASFFFEREDDFQDLDTFVRFTNESLGLNMKFLKGGFKEGVEKLVTEDGIAGIFIGTRSGDPNSKGQEFFCPSSTGWPPFMRINPILDWTYRDVWDFLLATKVQYCNLYNLGYTSLGNIHSTIPNVALRNPDGSFQPAYKLLNNKLERVGRVTTDQSSNNLLSLSNSSSQTQTSGGGGYTHTVCLVIVGDEILSGKVDEVNGGYLCQQFRAMGWCVRKISIVPDDVDLIAQEVKSLSCLGDFVVTTGGVGPTADDVTIEGVARAFDMKLELNSELQNRLKDYFGEKAMVSQAHMKMAQTPSKDVQFLQRTNGESHFFPILKCRNVFMLPGVPQLLRKKWDIVRDFLMSNHQSSPFRNVLINLKCQDETQIANALLEVDTGFDDVRVGSYPLEDNGEVGVVVSLESKDEVQLKEAQDKFCESISQEIILNVLKDQEKLTS